MINSDIHLSENNNENNSKGLKTWRQVFLPKPEPEPDPKLPKTDTNQTGGTSASTP